MQDFLTISKYTLWIICLYVMILPFFFILTPDVLQYNFTTTHLAQVLVIVAGTFLAFYVLNSFFHFRTIRWQNQSLSQIIVLIFYAALFAVPEEIIFRGIIQGALQHFIHDIFTVVIVSSMLFGLAHLPNGARGLHIKNLNWPFAMFAFLAGLPLSLIFVITNSLLIPTLVHASSLLLLRLFTYERFNNTHFLEAGR